MAAPERHGLPPRVRAEVQRIADAAARRLLDEHMSGKADHSDLFADKGAASRLHGNHPTRTREAS